MTNSSIKAVKPWVNTENFYRFVLAGLILRLFIIPFFGHVDVLSEARRIYFWDQASIYFDDISRNATALFQLLFFKVFSVFIENKDVLFAHADMQHSTANQAEYFEFVSQPTIFRVLFIIKLPFLAADLITAWALYQYCGRDDGAKRAVVFWLFNPMTLFAFYVFGRFESIPIMFCMLSLLALQRRYLLLAAVMTALSVNSRELFIFYGPIFIALVCSPPFAEFRLRTRIAAVAIVLFAVAVSVQLVSLTGGSLDAFGREVSSIASEARTNYLFKFIVGSYLMFPMAYFVLLLFAWNNRFAMDQSVLIVASLTIMAFFVFSEHTAHYASWMVVFPCLYFSKDRQFFRPMLILCVTWFIFNLSITDIGVFTTWLASPWSISLSGLPSFPMMYHGLGLSQYLEFLNYQRICRTMYVASIWYLAVLMMMTYYRERSLSSNIGSNSMVGNS